MSEELIAALTGRMQAFAQGDPGPVLDAQAVVEASDLFNRAVDPDGSVPLQVVHVVAWLHWCRYLALPEGQDQDDLQTAIGLFTPIADADPRAVPDELRSYLPAAGADTEPVRQAQTAAALLQRVMHRDDPAALDEAIALLTTAIKAAPADHPNRAGYLSSLGAALGTRFERTGAVADLDEAVAVGREAVAATPDDHPNRAGYLSDLGAALGTRFERTGAVADLDEAVAVGREAVAATPDDHPNRVGYLSNLAHELLIRFGRTGMAVDLDEAVTVGREAVAATPDDHPNRAATLSVLGGALGTRFERTGAIADLDEAVAVGREAVAATPADHPNRVGYLSNLALELRHRFERTGTVADLDEAVTVGREAVAATTDDHPNRAMYLSNLGAALGTRFERTGAAAGRVRRYRALADLDEAVAVGRRAVAATPDDHPNRAIYLSNLAVVLRARFERTGAVADLDEAVTVGREAVAATPDDHPGRAAMLSNLGNALRNRFERTGADADLDEAALGWAQASQSSVAPVTARLTAAKSRAWAIARRRGPDAAVEAYTEGVNLLPLLAWRGISHRDQQHLLHTHAASLARDGAACAIAADRLDLAVELLEAGRGVYWSQLLGTRTDLTALQQAAPELAEQLQNCRTVLEQPTTNEHTGLNPAQAVEACMRAARLFDTLVDEVRALPPTEAFPHPDRFLKPPPIDSLRPRAGDDPVAVINISRWRCDALLLTHQGITPVPLPELTEEQVIDEANRYLEALYDFDRSRRTDTDRFCLEMAITTTLEWLWDRIAAPILNQLGHTRTPTGRWPRLWWCPTGALTVLPLHAAGYHRTGEAVMDRAVSSYTPTVRALAHARTRDESTHPPQMLIIALPDTPGKSPLPGAATERDLLTSHFTLDEACTVLTGPEATRHTVLAHMSGYRWLHASCHGTQNLADPATGGLVPHDWKAGLVTVTDLASPENAGGEFAFLSACKTATGGVTNLDEAINVAAAMQHAGWRHVIGTLWSVWDHTATAVTDRLYPQLLKDGHFDPATAAHALHHTIRELRDTDPTSPSTWAPFIHTGP